jgi:hypothetical protein
MKLIRSLFYLYFKGIFNRISYRELVWLACSILNDKNGDILIIWFDIKQHLSSGALISLLTITRLASCELYIYIRQSSLTMKIYMIKIS